MTLDELDDMGSKHPGYGRSGRGRRIVGVSSLGASAGWTTQTGSTLQRSVDLDADCAGQIGGNDDATGYRGMGALTRGLAAEGVAREAGALSVRGDLQQRVTGARC
jgi:hypothetical protein